MRVRARRLLQFGGVLTVAGLLLLTTFTGAASGKAQHVSWDIVSVSPIPIAPPPPVTFNPGGVATAQTPEEVTITLTGSGTFVAPAGGSGGSNAATGGGTWSISGGGGGGTYTVKGLVAWEFASPQSLLIGGFPVTDNTGDTTERANGTAVLRIEYNDGSQGVLTVGCHGPGAPPGIFEGIAVTKGFTTFYNVPAPPPNVNTGRTLFHVRS